MFSGGPEKLTELKSESGLTFQLTKVGSRALENLAYQKLLGKFTKVLRNLISGPNFK